MNHTYIYIYIYTQLDKSNRVDIVWVVYRPGSLMASTKENLRGKGTRTTVAPSSVMPNNWRDFLRVSENKTELFTFLPCVAVHLSVEGGKEIHATDRSRVLCSPVESCLAHLDVHKRRPTLDYFCTWQML